MAQAFTVTASTSVVLISTLQSPNTIVLLSSLKNPGHIVGVRDTTGSNLISLYPVIISTMSGLKFYDGTSSIVLNQPNGAVSLSSRDSSTWQVLNTYGFLTTLSNAFLEQLTSQSAYLTSLVSASESISSVVAGRVNVLSSIQILGQTNIQGDITITGSFNVFSTLLAYENVYLSSGLTVGGNVALGSSLSVKDTLVVGSNLSTLQTLSVRDQLVINKSLYVQGALLPPFVSTQRLTIQTLESGGGLQVAGGISSVNVSVASNAFVSGKGLFEQHQTNQGLVSVYDSLTLGGAFRTQTLDVLGNIATGTYAQVQSLTASGAVSTLESLHVSQRVVSSNDGLVEGQLRSLGTSEVKNLTVLGQSYISSLAVYTTLESMGESSSWSSTFQASSELNVRGTLVTGGSLEASQASLSLQDRFSTLSNLSVYENLSVKGDLVVRMPSQFQGNVLTASTAKVTGNVSTTSLSALGQVFVDGSLYVNQIASASTLGAPISLNISTLSLSNALIVGSYGSVPELNLKDTPFRMAAGATSNQLFNDFYVDGILNNRSSVQQTYIQDYSKLWYANTLRASTLTGLSNISAAVVGSPLFEYPLLTATGYVVTGSNSVGGSNLSFGFNVSSIFRPAKGNFTLRGNKVAYNGSNLWIAVGIDASVGKSIQYSTDGYNWFGAATAAGGFPNGGNGIAYGGGRWIAVGTVGVGVYTQATIQTSLNGLVWTNCTGTVFNQTNGSGQGVAYNGTNLWVAVGSDPGVGGIKYSGTGTIWSNANLIPPNLGSMFVSVGYGNGLWLASDGSSTTYSSSNGINWLINVPAVPRLAYAFLSNINVWMGGGSNIGGNPLTTIQFSPNGSNWIPITSGGFQTACRDIQALGLSSVVAVGANAAPTETIIQYTSNIQDFTTNTVFRGEGYGIATGTLIAPSERPLFNVSLRSIFHNNVSSATVYASSIKASSITGFYTGDGANLSLVGTYTSSIRVSSLKTTTLKTFDISTGLYFGKLVTASDKIEVPRTTFFSTGNLFLATGTDSLANGNVQTSINGPQWSRALNNSFEYYGNAIAGNSNQTDSVFVAVGADSRTAYTVQYSINGRVWYPANTGGFSYSNTLGIREGKGVAYSDSLTRWVAVGTSMGSTNTILYSSDGSNWSEASGGFTDYGTTVKAQSNRFVAFGNGVRWSTDGITWNPSAPQPSLTAIGYGTVQSGMTTTDAWVGIATSNIYTSINNGQSWSIAAQTTVAPVSDITYKNSKWVAVGSNVIQTSLTGFAWSQATTNFNSNISFHSVVYNSNLGIWMAAATASSNLQTLWQSQDSLSWSQILSGGFSTSVDQYGIGYGVFSFAMSTIAVGQSALDINLNLLPSILNLSTNAGAPGSTITTLSLTASNASNVFSTSVRGIWATTNEYYQYVAVGDGINPQKTIARSIDATPGSWLPAITGGFSTTGYNVTYYQDRWIAVGDSAVSTNMIQYSPDGANWFGTNTAPGLRQGGRGVAVGIGSLGNTVVAVGKDTTTSTIVYSGNGSIWSNATGAYFNVQGNNVASGSNGSVANFIAVGSDTRSPENTILRSTDGITWTTITSGGFSVAGYGASYNKDLARWVTVGEDATPSKTIQYSLDGGDTFSAATNSFSAAGYGVTYNSSIGIYFAVGKDIDGNSPYTIKYSGDGVTWENFSTGSGFISQKSLGSANGLFTQPILTKETTPYMEFSNLVVYERTEPFLYFKPTIRLQSTFMSFNESLFINTSSQVIVGSNVPIGIADVSVYGNTFASTVFFRDRVPYPSTLFVSSMIVSTLSSIGTIETKSLFTPSLSINTPTEKQANAISVIAKSFFNRLAINNTLFVSDDLNQIYYQGIRTQDPSYPLQVVGTFGASTLSTSVLYAPKNIFLSSSQIYFEDDYFRMVEGENPSLALRENRIQTTPSSLTINSVLTLQVSTQRVGAYTTNPQYELDVQRQGCFTTLQANTINTSLLFLTLQSI